MPTTSKRSLWWPKTINYFRSQTYPHKRLLVGIDGISDITKFPGDIEVVVCHPMNSLGAKRNFINERVQTPLIAHWDDDDWSAPGRLADQVGRLGNKAVTGYRDMEFVGVNGRHYYTSTANYALGTSLLYRRDWWDAHQFDGLNVGEDNQFVKAAERAGQLVVADCRGLMVARDHPGNTSGRNYHTKQWKKLE